jgi:hypothetical protein
MPSTDTKPELTAKASMAQPVSQPAVYANGLRCRGKVGLNTIICLGNMKEGNRLEYMGADERAILKLVLKRSKVVEHGRDACYSG